MPTADRLKATAGRAVRVTNAVEAVTRPLLFDHISARASTCKDQILSVGPRLHGLEGSNGLARTLRLIDHSDREAALRDGADPKTSQDVVAMPLTRTKSSSTVRRGRPAGPSCRGGASSLLRLTQPESKRLPGTLDLAEWASRAAAVLMPVTGLHNNFAASEFGPGVGR